MLSLDNIYNAVDLAELAVEKGVTTLLIPLECKETDERTLRRDDNQNQYSISG